MKEPGPQPIEAIEVVQRYQLLQMGLTYNDIKNIDYIEAERLMMLNTEIKSYEEFLQKKSQSRHK